MIVKTVDEFILALEKQQAVIIHYMKQGTTREALKDLELSLARAQLFAHRWLAGAAIISDQELRIARETP
jgi:hypothetical protein